MDTSDPDITFDQTAVCCHCRAYEAYTHTIGDATARRAKLNGMIQSLKARGKRRDYDCIMGLSGGVDSSYLAWLAVREFGLRPLAVHVDTGWNSELAVANIRNIVQRLNLDLHTLVIDWNEMQDIQRAYFFSGVANLDVPQDHAFIASLYREARKYGIKDVLNGGNMQTESVLPVAWGYDASDSVNLHSIHRKYGRHPIRTYPTISAFRRLVYYPYILRMSVHRPLEYVDYDKAQAKMLLSAELGWRDYGGKHYESLFTKFHQAYYLPTKFGYDKRRAHLSSLIASGQIGQQTARVELSHPLYSERELRDELQYWLKKLDISREEFDTVMSQPPRFARDFDNDQRERERIRVVVRYFARLKRVLLRKLR